jgi:hypothetical protein
MSQRLSNSQIAFSDVVANPTERKNNSALEAHCTSESCCRYKTKGGKFAFHTHVIVDNAKKRDIDCPNCGHALYWHNPNIDLDDIN